MSDRKEEASVLGFDLGHGESSVALLDDAYSRRGQRGVQPQCLFSPKSQPTIFATLQNGGTVWGQRARSAPRVVNDRVIELELGFKAKPGDPQTDEAISTFARCVLGDTLAELNGRLKERTEWFVGCPSAWDEATRDAYRDLFLKAGFGSVNIVKESRAAFSYYYENNNVVTGMAKRATVVLDFGSSTLDATLAVGLMDEEIDSGCPLGASWIDKAILNWNLTHCSDDDFPAGRQDAAKISRILSERENVRNVVELKVRETKESYFNQQDSFPDATCPLLATIMVRDLIFNIAIHGGMMDEVLNTPLEAVVPELTSGSVSAAIRQQLEGRSWLGRCAEFLAKVSEDLNEKNYDLTDVSNVLLTGGASRMQPVRQLVGHFFSRGQELHVINDLEPELSIARGLACWGRTTLQTESFRAEATTRLLGDDFLWSTIKKNCQSAGLQNITNNKWAEVTLSWLRYWKGGNIKSERIGIQIAYELRTWANSDGLDKGLKTCVEQVERSIRGEINAEARELLRKYQVPDVNFLSQTPMFTKLKDYFSDDCERIATAMERDSSFRDLGDRWWDRNLFVSEDSFSQVVESTRQKWVEVDIKNLYQYDHNRQIFVGIIQDSLTENIEKAIIATQYLLAGNPSLIE